MRQVHIVEALVAVQLGEGLPLVARRAEPEARRLVEHQVEQHQSRRERADGRGSPFAVVGLADGCVQTLVVHMVEASAVQRARTHLARQPAPGEPTQEVVRLLAVRDACIRALLPLNEHARVLQHEQQEGRLLRSEPFLPQSHLVHYVLTSETFHDVEVDHRRSSSASPPRGPLPLRLPP